MDKFNPKFLTIFFSSLLSLFAPIMATLIIVFVFMFVDFVVGFIVSIKVHKQGFVTEKAYQTIFKVAGAEICVLLTWLVDTYILTFTTLNIANILAGIICGIELWSILANFAILSNHPVFRIIKKWAKSEIEHKIPGLTDFDKEI